MSNTKILLEENEIPTHWYNVIADMPNPPAPPLGPDGQPMSYSLDHKEGGKRLREEQTLPDAEVRDGDHLIVYPEIVAGG